MHGHLYTPPYLGTYAKYLYLIEIGFKLIPFPHSPPRQTRFLLFPSRISSSPQPHHAHLKKRKRMGSEKESTHICFSQWWVIEILLPSGPHIYICWSWSSVRIWRRQGNTTPHPIISTLSGQVSQVWFDSSPFPQHLSWWIAVISLTWQIPLIRESSGFALNHGPLCSLALHSPYMGSLAWRVAGRRTRSN